MVLDSPSSFHMSFRSHLFTQTKVVGISKLKNVLDVYSVCAHAQVPRLGLGLEAENVRRPSLSCSVLIP